VVWQFHDTYGAIVEQEQAVSDEPADAAAVGADPVGDSGCEESGEGTVQGQVHVR
jgi:hypothetical protein